MNERVCQRERERREHGVSGGIRLDRLERGQMMLSRTCEGVAATHFRVRELKECRQEAIVSQPLLLHLRL